MLNDNRWKYYRFAFINGDGKAGINTWTFQLHDEDPGVKDGPSLIKFYQGRMDASVDSAMNFLLSTIREHKGQSPDNTYVADVTERLRGGGAWLASKDIQGSLFGTNGTDYVLRLGKLADGNVEVTYSGEGSVMTIAPPGSGKTQCFVLPNLLQWKGAAVVLDVKGEIYAATSKWRAENVGPVYRFSPLDPANSNRYNPLVYVRQDPEYIWEDSRFLADMLIVPTGGNDPFWENSARDVLTAAIAYLCLYNKPEDRPMSRILDILYGIGWDEMVMALKTNVLVGAMRQSGHSLADMEKKTRDSVLKTAQSSMSAWQGERIKKTTARSDWDPRELRNNKATVYICINPNEIDSYLSVLRVLIAQHIRLMTAELPPRGAAPVLFVLDELPRLKKMPPVDEALNIGRQYGIKLWMFTQSYGQLKEAYPNAEGMLGSCAVRIFMNVPLNDELAQNLSDQLGYREGPLDSTRVKLLEPMELAGPNFRDIALVLASNTKPAKVRKVFAWQDTELSQRMGQVEVQMREHGA
jgi:type IV secretion system protein VirD4